MEQKLLGLSSAVCPEACLKFKAILVAWAVGEYSILSQVLRFFKRLFCCTLENKQNPSHVSAKRNAGKTFFLDKVRFALLPSPHRKRLMPEPPPPPASEHVTEAEDLSSEKTAKFREMESIKTDLRPSVRTRPAGARAAARPDAEHVSNRGANPSPS